ncbi:MAG: DUF2341 domain-containing protein [Chitinispirillaceae bacterium]|nr:DUF2341 domain-containing protein [Chitinispirillaceae bacterium]
MRMKRFIAFLFLLPLTGAVTFQCTSIAGGNGSETTNGYVAGRFIDEDGSPAVQARVMLLASTYNPVEDGAVPDSLTDTTDEEGRYLLRTSGEGIYNIEAVDPGSGKRALISSVPVVQNDTAHPEDRKIRNTGTILVVPGETRISLDGYLYIPGTTCFSEIHGERIRIDSVPTGSITSMVYTAATGSVADSVIAADISVSPENTTVIAESSVWKYSRRILLNTGISGADIAGTVTDFPVLIRLTADNFDFSLAQDDGSDIRFMKSDFSTLPCEIERWDTGNRKAELWVKVDTIYGGDSLQELSMYWGNPDAAMESSGADVFDTADGFQSVWHLGGNGTSVVDVTANGYNGTQSGTVSRVEGMIGYGRYFSGLGNFVEIGNAVDPDVAEFTVCAWVKPSGSNYRTILSKSAGGEPSSSYGWLFEFDPEGALVVFMATDTGVWGEPRTFVLSSDPATVDTVEWHHVALVIDRSANNKCAIYLDGIDVSSRPAAGDITGLGEVVNSVPLRIGAESDGEGPLLGSLDECSLSVRARSADWIRLCYMNQRMDDMLVEFR